MKLALKEFAARLNLPEETVERWIRQGRIPAFRSGAFCTFREQAMEKWAIQNNIRFSAISRKDGGESHPPGSLAAAIREGGVDDGFSARDPESALTALVNGLSDLPEGEHDLLFSHLMDRERLGSTGIGNGVALPHPRTPVAGYPETPRIRVGYPKHPVAYGALDDQPVHTFFLLLSPSTREHLQLLSRLSFCLRDPGFRGFLETRPDADALAGRIAQMEARLDNGAP